MTNEQARKMLKRMSMSKDLHGDEVNAINVAIEALSETKRDLSEDLISRAKAIDTANAMRKMCDTNSIDDYRDLLVEALGVLPSAQPERKTGEWEEIEVIPKAYDIAGVKTWASKMRCDQCSFATIAIEGHFAQYNFCPNCGADMRGE